MKNTTHSFNSYRNCFIFTFFIALSILSTCLNTGANATSPSYTMTFSITNFNSPSLLADADDLSNPMNSFFRLKNGTHLWYAITVKSRPAGISLTPADPADDLIAATFFGTFPLLPPIQILPFDQQDNTYPYEILKLQASFYGPDQHLQLILSPIDPHAVTLDILNLLLNLLGQHAPTASIGLLAPGTLAEILALAPTMKDFQALIKSYTSALQNAANRSKVQKYAHQCSVNLTALLGNAKEQAMLATMLWKMQGKAISRQSILSTIVQFSTLPFAQPLTDSISNTLFALSSTLLQQNMPSLFLQTSSIVTPTPRPTPTPTPTPMPTPTPTPRPTPTLVPISTPKTRSTSMTNTTCTMKTTPTTHITCTTTNATCTTINTASTTHITCITKIIPAPKVTPTTTISPATLHRHKKPGATRKAQTSKIKHAHCLTKNLSFPCPAFGRKGAILSGRFSIRAISSNHKRARAISA
jgi:hypothetical protein